MKQSIESGKINMLRVFYSYDCNIIREVSEKNGEARVHCIPLAIACRERKRGVIHRMAKDCLGHDRFRFVYLAEGEGYE
jgi:hypothetical protein